MTDEISDRVRALEIAQAETMVTLRHISEVVDDLRRTNQELRDALNKGRGALWLAMLAAGVISAAVTTAVKRLIGL